LSAQSTPTKESPPAREQAPPAWVDFLRAHATLTRRLDAAMRELHGLTLHEYEVLLQLWLADEARLRRVDLAERLLITQGGVTRLLAGLERRGLVERASCESDGRVVYAQLTADGSRTIETARSAHLRDVRRLFSERFDSRELRTLGELLARLTDGGSGPGRSR
jgi:DNA-binding MarR family transcriptional regulator